jgi:serine/threonine-protein kinase
MIQRAWAREPIPIQVGLAIATKLATSLERVHEANRRREQGETAGDRFITPEAVFVGFDGTVKVAGFGVAPTPEQLATTDPSIGVRMVSYMAPEQLRGEITDHRADLFGLGSILFEMLTGRRPFEGRLRGAADSAIEEHIPDLGEERADSPPELVELLFELLCVDPEFRPASVAAVTHRLEELLEDRISWEGAIQVSDFVLQHTTDEEIDDFETVARAPAAGTHHAPPASPAKGDVVRDAVVIALMLGLAAALGWITRIFIP